MKYFKKIFDFYVFSNLHVAIASFCFTKLTLLFYNNNSNLIPLFVLTVTFLAYNFLRLYDINNTDNWLKNWVWNHLIWLMITSFIAFTAMVYLIININKIVLLWFIPIFFLTIFYIMPVVKYKDRLLSFRMYPYIKIIYVVFVWSFTTVFIPFLSLSFNEFDNLFYLFFASRFLLFIALIIPFEIRDLSYDNLNLKTLPQTVGIKKSKLLGVLLLLFCGLLNFLIYNNRKAFLIALLILLISSVLIMKSTSNQSKYYSAFWVEGIPILWLFLFELQL